MSVPEVDLGADLLPRHGEALRALSILRARIDSDCWCLVGGMMVLIAARLAGSTHTRAETTKDADVVVDVLADVSRLAKAYRTLRQAGYEPLPDIVDDEALTRCTLISGGAHVDLLGPEDAPPDALEDTEQRFRSVGIPGGRRALELAEPVTVLWGSQGIIEIRVPRLFGAIVVKSYACLDPRTRGQPRHIEDVAFLLSVVDDPIAAAVQLADDAAVVARTSAMLLEDPLAARGLDVVARRRALATARFLV